MNADGMVLTDAILARIRHMQPRHGDLSRRHRQDGLHSVQRQIFDNPTGSETTRHWTERSYELSIRSENVLTRRSIVSFAGTKLLSTFWASSPAEPFQRPNFRL